MDYYGGSFLQALTEPCELFIYELVIKNVPHASGIHTPDRRSIPLDWSGQVKITIHQLLSCEGPPERSTETAGACRRSPAHPSPRRRQVQAQALARVKRRRRRQEARAPGLWQNFARSIAHECGWYGW